MYDDSFYECKEIFNQLLGQCPHQNFNSVSLWHIENILWCQIQEWSISCWHKYKGIYFVGCTAELEAVFEKLATNSQHKGVWGKRASRNESKFVGESAESVQQVRILTLVTFPNSQAHEKFSLCGNYGHGLGYANPETMKANSNDETVNCMKNRQKGTWVPNGYFTGNKGFAPYGSNLSYGKKFYENFPQTPQVKATHKQK